jgi:hypothetical protein
MDDINHFLGDNAGGKMKETGTALKSPNEALLTAVVLQVFREGIVTTMVHSKHWQLVTGEFYGEQYFIRLVPS